MLRKIAIALVAASMLTGPAFAKGETAGKPAVSSAVAKPATAHHQTARAKHRHVKRVRHVRHVRHVKHIKRVNKQISKHAAANRARASAKPHLRTMKHKASAQAVVGAKAGQRSTN